MYGKDGRTGIPGQLLEGGIDMKRSVLYFLFSAATVYVTMSYLIKLFVGLLANFSLAVI